MQQNLTNTIHNLCVLVVSHPDWHATLKTTLPWGGRQLTAHLFTPLYIAPLTYSIYLEFSEYTERYLIQGSLITRSARPTHLWTNGLHDSRGVCESLLRDGLLSALFDRLTNDFKFRNRRVS
jgi:hypothetical protein